MTVTAVLALLAAGACLAGTVYHVVAALLVVRYMRAPRPSPLSRPPVSVLKPLCGDEPGLARNLRCVLHQNYPDYGVVFGVSDASDPAAAVARRVLEEGGGQGDLVVDGAGHGTNLKIGNLLNMMPKAGGDVIVIADSDVRVTPTYLDDVVAPFSDRDVGLVTALYVARPEPGLASRLGALGVNHGFLPSALVARALGRKDGCFGATMALRRDTLSALGGLERFRDILADDWALGAAVRERGLSIALTSRPVEIVVNEKGIRGLLAHEIRWGRTISIIDRPAFLASVIMQPLVFAVLAVFLGGWPYLGLMAVAALARFWAIRTEERALDLSRASVMSLVLRETLNVVVFIAASVGRSVSWRGRRFRVRRDGTMELLEGYPR